MNTGGFDIGDIFGEHVFRPRFVAPKDEHTLDFTDRVNNRIGIYNHAIHTLSPGGR